MVNGVDFSRARSFQVTSTTLKVVRPVETVARSLTHELTSVAILDSRNVSTSYQHGVCVFVRIVLNYLLAFCNSTRVTLVIPYIGHSMHIYETVLHGQPTHSTSIFSDIRPFEVTELS